MKFDQFRREVQLMTSHGVREIDAIHKALSQDKPKKRKRRKP